MIFVNRSRERMPRKFLTEWERRCRTALRRAPEGRTARVPRTVTVVFVDPPEMRRINREFRGKNYATDVLSFDQSPAEGELIICPQVLRRNADRGDLSAGFARAGRWSFRAELALIVLHGLLHLGGLEHSEEARAEEPMLRLQNRLFAGLFLRRK